MIDAEPRLKPVAPTSINIVCYCYQPAGVSNDKLKAINTEIMLRLQQEGTAIISDTTVHGAYCLRVAINNHRTRYDDLRLLIKETIRLGEEIANESAIN